MVSVLRRNLEIAGCLIVVVLCVPLCFAENNERILVSVAIPAQNGLNVSVSKVMGSTWVPATNMDFGNLRYDPLNNIFVADAYYVIDVGIESNSSTWTVTHTVTSMTNGTESIDKNINVTFFKQSATIATQLDKVSYEKSNNKSFTKSQLAGDWLRIYYGLATGESAKDASDVVPLNRIGTAGNYQGKVNFTLTP